MQNIPGVPDFDCFEYAAKQKDFAVLIPIINEGDRIREELRRAKEAAFPPVPTSSSATEARRTEARKRTRSAHSA